MVYFVKNIICRALNNYGSFFKIKYVFKIYYVVKAIMIYFQNILGCESKQRDSSEQILAPVRPKHGGGLCGRARQRVRVDILIFTSIAF